jgi:hypothetical protein
MKAIVTVEHSTRMPDVSWISGDATGSDDDGVDDFLESMIDPMYFNSTSTLPDTTDTMVAPYNTATASSSTVGSFFDLPNYGFNDTTSRNLHQPVVTNSTVPTSFRVFLCSEWWCEHSVHYSPECFSIPSVTKEHSVHEYNNVPSVSLF